MLKRQTNDLCVLSRMQIKSFFVYSPSISEPCSIQKLLTSPWPQSYNTDSPKHEKRSLSLSVLNTGKGWGAFLTTEHTTHTLGTHGNHAFKECSRESGLERKGLESCQDCQENFDTALRVQEAAGSNPVTRTKNPLFSTENSGFFF